MPKYLDSMTFAAKKTPPESSLVEVIKQAILDPKKKRKLKAIITGEPEGREYFAVSTPSPTAQPYGEVVSMATLKIDQYEETVDQYEQGFVDGYRICLLDNFDYSIRYFPTGYIEQERAENAYLEYVSGISSVSEYDDWWGYNQDEPVWGLADQY